MKKLQKCSHLFHRTARPQEVQQISAPAEASHGRRRRPRSSAALCGEGRAGAAGSARRTGRQVMRAARPAPPRLADTGGAGARREQSCPPPPPPPQPPPPPRPPPTRPPGPAALPRPPARPPPAAAAARLGSSRPRSQQVPRRARGEGRARRRRACSLLAWRRGARRRRPAGASRSRALPRALAAPPLTLGVHASARARPGQRARRGPGGLAPAALGRGACAREGGGAGTVSRGRCGAGWLPAWARLRGEAAHWATRVPRAGSIPSACAGAVVAPGAPVPGQGPWARGWESPAAPGDGRLMGVVDEARHAGGEELPLASRSPGGLCGFYPAAQSSQNTKTSCLPPRPSPATENLFR
nr:putative HTLV-1-related endogenous sequence [Pongo pygmaeus]